MSNKTRKRLWPASLVMAIAIVGVLAAFLALGTSPTNTEAHDGASGPTHCDDLGNIGRFAHDNDPENDHDCATGPSEELPQLDMPTSVMVAERNPDQALTVSWASVEGAGGYKITWSPASRDGTSMHELGSDATSYTITGLAPATSYTIMVVALGVADESEDSMAAETEGTTNPVAYDLLLSHEAANGTITCPERSAGRPACIGGSNFQIGDFEEINAGTLNDPDPIDKATIRTPGRVTIHAEVQTDSPEDTTTVTIRIEHSNGTSELAVGDDTGITYFTSGLNAPGERSIEDGTLDIQIRDEASRIFDVHVDCSGMPADLTGTLDLEVRDDRQALVAQATIMCAPPEEIVVTEEITACYTISGMPDQGDDPDTLAVEGEDIELFPTDKSVQLTVTSYEKVYSFTTTNGVRTLDADYPKDCPDWPQSSVFIRLVDMPGAMPMGDDDDGFVDENGLIDDHGAVTGVSSGGELMLDIMDTVDVDVPGQTDPDEVGVRKGTFRVFTPTDVAVGDQYYVELYDNLNSERIKHQNALTGAEQDYERVVYVSTDNPMPLSAPTRVNASADGSVITVTWMDGSNAQSHIVLLFDSNFALAKPVQAGQTDGRTMFQDVAAGTYTVVVVAVESASHYLYAYDTVTVGQ